MFCHAPLVERDEPLELLDYLVERLPIAHAKRGHLELAAWVDLLLTKLSDAAAIDHEIRRAVLRSGWALR